MDDIDRGIRAASSCSALLQRISAVALASGRALLGQAHFLDSGRSYATGRTRPSRSHHGGLRRHVRRPAPPGPRPAPVLTRPALLGPAAGPSAPVRVVRRADARRLARRHDTHINETKTGPLPVAEYSVLLMHSTPCKCWSLGELAPMLEDTGFTGFTYRATAADCTAIVARKPA
jgi:hypothetical protein